MKFLVLGFLFLISCTSANSEKRFIELKTEVDDLKSRVEELDFYAPKFGIVNLSQNSQFQVIDPFFKVIISDTKEHLTGIKIKGEILNMSGVRPVSWMN